MTHIEFIGPGGSGKSSIHKKLIKDHNLYDAVQEDGYNRYLSNNTNLSYGFIYRFSPFVFKSFLKKWVIEANLDQSMSEEFWTKNPKFMSLVYSLIGDVRNDSIGAWRNFNKLFINYQLGIETIFNHEKLCIDEGFAHKAASIIHRELSDPFPYDKYLSISPKPDILIFVDCPVETCLARQKERGRVPSNNSWTKSPKNSIRRASDICNRIVNHYQDTSTSVLIVQNVGDLEDTVRCVKEEIDKIGTLQLSQFEK